MSWVDPFLVAAPLALKAVQFFSHEVVDMARIDSRLVLDQIGSLVRVQHEFCLPKVVSTTDRNTGIRSKQHNKTLKEENHQISNVN